MDNNRRIVVLALLIVASAAIEIQNAGSFPTGTDYQKEKAMQGQDPANYKKTYHRVIPGGSEHAEVVASNGPGSNSFSQTYSKHQSFGSADTMQSQDAMDRHNAIMSSIQQSMGGMGMGMGAPMSPFGSSESKMYYGPDGFDDWMRNHIKMMNEMMRMQNAQIQALQQLIASSSYPRQVSSPVKTTQIHYQVPKTVDGEAYVPRRASRGDSEKRDD